MIPEGYVEKHLPDAESALFFGVPIKDLTREELLACAIGGWKAHKQEMERHFNYMGRSLFGREE